MAWYAIERPDGTQEFLDREPDPERDQPFLRSAPMPSPPAMDGSTIWDFAAAIPTISLDVQLEAINAEHIAMTGEHMIASAHDRKTIEARIMKAGVPLDGLVAREAAAKGIDPLDLCDTILAQADIDDQAEVDRIMARWNARL